MEDKPKQQFFNSPILTIFSCVGIFILSILLAIATFPWTDENYTFVRDSDFIIISYALFVFCLKLLFVWSVIRIIIWLKTRRQMLLLPQLFFFSLGFLSVLALFGTEDSIKTRIRPLIYQKYYGIVFWVNESDYNGNCNNKIIFTSNKAPKWRSFPLNPRGDDLKFYKGKFYLHESSCCDSLASVTVLDMHGRKIKYCEDETYYLHEGAVNWLGRPDYTLDWDKIYKCGQK